MLTGENVASAEPTAHAASALPGPPPSPPPPVPIEASTVMMPLPVAPPAPVAALVVTEPPPLAVFGPPEDPLPWPLGPNALPRFSAEQPPEPAHTTTANTAGAVIRCRITTASWSDDQRTLLRLVLASGGPRRRRCPRVSWPMTRCSIDKCGRAGAS